MQSGIFNLTRTSKQLYFSCKDGRTIQLTVPVRPVVEPAVQPAVQPAYAQASALTGSISGTLTFWGNLQSGYSIGLFSAPSISDTALTTTTSGADGAFIFSGLAAGSYDVAFEGKGWNYRSKANGAGNFITVTAGGTANGNIIFPYP